MLALRGLIPLLLSSSLIASSAGDALIDLKKEQLELEQKVNELKAKNLKYQWINPIFATYSYSKSDQFSKINKSRYFAVSVDQPIFKSGGIYFAIKYSDASKNFSELLTKIKSQSLRRELYTTLIELKKIDLLIEKLKLQIDSAKIDVDRKREQYEASLIDSSFLDSAILKLNGLKEKLLETKAQRESLHSKFKTLSKRDYHTLSVPSFRLVTKDEFIDKNLELQKAKSKATSDKYIKNMTISNYLPTVSLFGEYSWQKDSFRVFRQNDEHKRYGIKVSMPIINLNRSRDIQIKKIEYLKSKLAIKEMALQQRSFYESFVSRLESLKRRRELANENRALYKKLVASTRDGVKAGDKSKMDLKSMKNSQKIAGIDAKITDLDIAKELIEFTAKMSNEI